MKLWDMKSYGSGVSHKSPTYGDIYSKSLTLAPSAANASQRIKPPHSVALNNSILHWNKPGLLAKFKSC